jgi:hypothetical protein
LKKNCRQRSKERQQTTRLEISAGQMPKVGRVVDFKNLSADEEKALCAVLKSCRYLKESANWNVGENVLREVSQDIARDYAAMERATAVKTKVSK